VVGTLVANHPGVMSGLTVAGATMIIIAATLFTEQMLG
jgi:hypothetical protein